METMFFWNAMTIALFVVGIVFFYVGLKHDEDFIAFMGIVIVLLVGILNGGKIL